MCCLLQGPGGDSAVKLLVLLQDRVETAPGSPLQDEAQRLQYHTNEVYHVGMVEAMQQGDFSTDLIMGVWSCGCGHVGVVSSPPHTTSWQILS